MTPWIFILTLYLAPGASQQVVLTFPTQELCNLAQAHVATASSIRITTQGGSVVSQGHAVQICQPEAPAPIRPGIGRPGAPQVPGASGPYPQE
jgi:hypothetical protein